MKLKPYPKYKDSGVEWLGDVPDGWKIPQLKLFASFQTGSTPSTLVPEFYSEEEAFPWYRPEDISEDDNKVFATKFLSNIGEFEVRKSRAGCTVICGIGTIGKAALATQEFATNQQLIAIDSKLNDRYCFYLISSARSELESLSTGNVVRILNNERLGSLVIPLVEVDIQTQIANFLDRETNKLDTLIAKQEHLIELLKEKRQAVISHAVTKGLNPDATMKDSGVEWLGMVPEDWKVLQFRHMALIQNGSDYKHIESEDGEFPVIGSGGEFRRATDYIYDGASVLLGRKGTVDKPLYIEGKFWVVDTMFYTIIKEIVLPKYVFNCAKIIPFDLLSTSTALPSMTQNDLKQLLFAMPVSKSEQQEIVDHIEIQTSKIDTLILKAQRSIELAKEHRTALISAAVTGKIDVREAA